MGNQDGTLELTGLRRTYGEVVALDDLSFTAPPGQVFGFLGPNGAGKTTAMRATDLALALVEDDLGRDVAHTVAQELVLFLRRPGSQSQFSLPLWSAPPRTDPIRAVLSAIHTDPGARRSIADLAGHAGLSPRHLQRRFTAEIGSPPAAYVERARIGAAQRALTDTDDPLATVARRYGFGTAETLRRAFHRNTSVAPSDYRDRFRSTTPSRTTSRPAVRSP